MPDMTPEISSVAIVLVGSFNPAIFHPSWFSANGIIAGSQLDSAETKIVTQELSQMTIDTLDILISRNRFQISTARAAFPVVRDTALSVFKLLGHTPITQVGINREVHFKFESEAVWNSFGYHLVPPKDWRTILKDPGMLSLSVRGKRKDEYAGSVNVRVEPSVSVHPGVVMQHNDHYELSDEHDATKAVELLSSEWSSSLERAAKTFDAILQWKD
jgi:hypothetical protein